MRRNRKNKYGFYAKFSKYRDNDISVSRFDVGNYPCIVLLIVTV